MIDVLVLCKDRPDFLRRAIERLDAQHVEYRGVLVDNSDTSLMPRAAAKRAGWTVIDGAPWWNYSKSLNEAIAATDSPHVMWLSDDAYLHDGALAKLVEADRPIVTPLLLTSDGKVCFAGGEFDGAHPHHVGRGDDPADWYGHGSYQTQWVTTPAALIRRDVLVAAGPMDERYQWCYEDVDFCMRAAQVGFGSWVCTDALCTHDEAGTKSLRGTGDSGRHFVDKWAGVLTSA